MTCIFRQLALPRGWQKFQLFSRSRGFAVFCSFLSRAWFPTAVAKSTGLFSSFGARTALPLGAAAPEGILPVPGVFPAAHSSRMIIVTHYRLQFSGFKISVISFFFPNPLHAASADFCEFGGRLASGQHVRCSCRPPGRACVFPWRSRAPRSSQPSFATPSARGFHARAIQA